MHLQRRNLIDYKTTLSQKRASHDFTFIVFLMSLLLAACGTTNIPVSPTSTPAPTETRIVLSPEPALVMETSTPSPATFANADITFVRAIQAADGSWTFHVTVSHPDTGWDDYANGWDIVLPDGSKLLVHEEDEFTRLLAHPHVDEQPFTRSQSGIIIPENITQVVFRAHDILDGFGGLEVVIDLTKDSGLNYEIERKE